MVLTFRNLVLNGDGRRENGDAPLRSKVHQCLSVYHDASPVSFVLPPLLCSQVDSVLSSFVRSSLYIYTHRKRAKVYPKINPNDSRSSWSLQCPLRLTFVGIPALNAEFHTWGHPPCSQVSALEPPRPPPCSLQRFPLFADGALTRGG